MGGHEGQFVWYDLMSTDPQAAVEFYKKVIGWETKAWEGDMPYQMWMNGDDPMGGVMELPKEAQQMGAPSHWIAYVGVKDTTRSVNKARDLGAEVLVPPTQIPEVGSYAVLRDPQGAVISVYTSVVEEDLKKPKKATHGWINWHELMTTDQEAAFTFYQQMFGWKKTEVMDMGRQGMYQMYGLGDQTFGGMMTKPDEMPVSAWLYYITVDDLDAAVARVKEHGGKVVREPFEVPGGDRIAHGVDPQGAMFALHETAATA